MDQLFLSSERVSSPFDTEDFVFSEGEWSVVLDRTRMFISTVPC